MEGGGDDELGQAFITHKNAHPTTAATATITLLISRGKEREQAIASLIDAYREKYKGQPDAFYVSPAIAFVASEGGGIAVMAKDAITMNTKEQQGNRNNNHHLIVLPHEERVSVSNVTSESLLSVLEEIKLVYQAKADSTIVEGEYTLRDVLLYGHVALCLVIMHGMAIPATDEQDALLLPLVIQTWPNYEEMCQSCSIWEFRPEVRRLLKGTITAEHIRLHQKSDRLVFEEIIQPTLVSMNKLDLFLPSPPPIAAETEEEEAPESKSKRLFQAYLHASFLVRSRAHKGRQQDEPEIIPLVDLLNGLPQHCALNSNSTSSAINAFQAARHTNVIAANRDICAGEELVHSYGDHTVDSFIRFYGCCPKEILTAAAGGGSSTSLMPYHSVDNILLKVPVSLAPPNELREWACQQLDLPSTQHEIEHIYICHLMQDSLEPYSQDMQQNTLFLLGKLGPTLPGTEHSSNGGPKLENLCQYLKLCHLVGDKDVREIVETRRLGSVKFNFMHLSHMLQLVVDHVLQNVTDLASSTNESDLEKANDPDMPHDLSTAYLARISQRNALAQWRHAFCYRHGLPSQHSESSHVFDHIIGSVEGHHLFLTTFSRPQAPPCLLTSRGCHYCGRTLYLKSCSKCNLTKYCCREHQKLDWKWHKHTCGIVS